MTDKFDPKIVIEDVRFRNGAIMTLIYAMDAQAMTLLRIYVTVGVASLAGALAALSPGVTSFPAIVAWGLLLLFGIMIYGALWCFRALGPARVSLPGRKADFWQWALREDVPTDRAMDAYLTSLAAQAEVNDAASTRSARALTHAKYAGAVALPVAVAVALYVVRLRLG